jgi:PfaD family protein
LEPAAFARALRDLHEPAVVVDTPEGHAVTTGGNVLISADATRPGKALPLVAFAPPLTPEHLGDPAFRETHGVRCAYVAGEMANGIASAAMVEAMARAGMLGFFGSAGLTIPEIEAAIARIQASVGDKPYGFNLIHSPYEPALEEATVDLYLARGVRLIGAAAFLDLTPAIVRYRVKGLRRGPDGIVEAPNRIAAKVSRVEVARKFMAPPPAEILAGLVASGKITQEEAELASAIPMAGDITAEADSGGHTDNRPALTLLPGMLALRDELQAAHRFPTPVRVGLAGGIATPESVAAAFAMGAAYVLTGSINQASVEAGTSATVKTMLAKAGQADVVMAPAADMFEMGVKVQVLKWGTMFPVRARKLYELYLQYASLDDLPAGVRQTLERDYFRSTLEQAWQETERFFEQRDPEQIARAQRDPKHKMALVFRKYLGQSSSWAIAGEPSRRQDFQIWCGPAMGAFNDWARGSFLEAPENRTVTAMAMNLMAGACVVQRAAWLRSQGARLPAGVDRFRPIPPDDLARYM